MNGAKRVKKRERRTAQLEPFRQNVMTTGIERRRYVQSDKYSGTSVARCCVHVSK